MATSQDPLASHTNPLAWYIDECITEAWCNYFQAKPHSPELQARLDALGHVLRDSEVRE